MKAILGYKEAIDANVQPHKVPRKPLTSRNWTPEARDTNARIQLFFNERCVQVRGHILCRRRLWLTELDTAQDRFPVIDKRVPEPKQFG